MPPFPPTSRKRRASISLERNPAPNLRPVPHDEIDLTIERAAPDEDLMMEGEMTPAEDTIVLNDTEM
ncbi:hypothetical protein B0H17DRAFT_1196652 [Mycena rosella]|uniref:Uncharacterized protein n=1 Tax=Mycena rosella TaxID=1033263 RepID=A0AAD7DVB4_MYCRO|nr:hypothetical protein B0H17DRAFT_1196652 [Mycena rosella]